VPLVETIEGFAELIATGLIRHWGVSNFEVDDLAELTGLAAGGAVETDQVLYNLARRGIEGDLLPLCQEEGLPIMAYSPIEQGRVLDHPVLVAVADDLGATPSQVALAWVLRQDLVIAIPRAGTPRHVEENRKALDVHLTPEHLAALDRAFPRPPVP
jgi:diketogulonate reductase-like aldo/keto reductase